MRSVTILALCLAQHRKPTSRRPCHARRAHRCPSSPPSPLLAEAPRRGIRFSPPALSAAPRRRRRWGQINCHPMLPADLQVALLLALTAHSSAPPPYPHPGGAGAPVVSWGLGSYTQRICGFKPVPRCPLSRHPPSTRPAACACPPTSPSLSLPPSSGTARTRGKACTCQGRKTSQGCEGTLPHLLPSDMTDTFNVRQRALSQPLTVEVVGGKRPRTATRATASQPETRRPGT